MNDFMLIGRREECDELDRCARLFKPQFVVVYGRRRVGKTYLVDTYFKNRFTFNFTGVHKLSERDQLASFSRTDPLFEAKSRRAGRLERRF